MTPENAIEIIRAAEAVERAPMRRGQPIETPSIVDVGPAREVLATAWAARHGFSPVVDGGYWNLLGGAARGDFPLHLPGDALTSTWAWLGKPFIYVSQPYADELTERTREIWDECDRDLSLVYRILDEPGWRNPGRTLFVCWARRGDWRLRNWPAWGKVE